MAKPKSIWVVIVEDENEPDDDFLLLFPTEAMAESAVDYINSQDSGDIEARIFQEQYMTTDLAKFKKEHDEYLEDRYTDEGGDGEEED